MRTAEGFADVEDVDGFVARLGAVGDEFHCATTAFDARYVAGRRHLEAAANRANRAFARDDAIADDRSIEILLYAAGRRQITRALSMGVSEGRQPLVILVDSDDGSVGDESAAAEAIGDLLEPAPVLGVERDEGRIREFFEVSDAELGATDASLEDLVIERVSLLVVDK